jgi:hypothetical protein
MNFSDEESMCLFALNAATKEMDLYESENCDAQDRSVMLSVGNFNSG